jgi:hypothetical protein
MQERLISEVENNTHLANKISYNNDKLNKKIIK